MAEDSDLDVGAPTNLDTALTSLVEQIFDPKKLIRLERAMRNAHAEGATVAQAAQVGAVTETVSTPDKLLEIFEKVMGGFGGFVMSAVVENAFGVDVSQADFTHLGATAGRADVAAALTKKMIEGLTGGSTSVEASAEPAARYLSVVLRQAFESWAISEFVEIASALVPYVDKIEHLQDVADKIVTALGIGDSSSRVLRPYIDNLVVEPLRRHIAQTYQPALLSEGLAVRQFLRGRWTRERLEKELKQQGWDVDRIDAHINAGQKFISVDDAMTLATEGGWSPTRVRELAQDQGYSEETALDLILVDGLKRTRAIMARPITDALQAYSNREISRPQLHELLNACVSAKDEIPFLENAADIKRQLTVAHMSRADVERAVKLGVLAMVDYRRWLEREAFPDDEALALEILLRAEMDKDAHVEQLRAIAAAERAAEKQARVDAAKARERELEQQRALARQGPIADLKRAAVRGLLPISRVESILAQQYEADAVAAIVGLLEQDRQDYLAEQKRREDALKRAPERKLDVGALEQAVLEHVLTVDEFAGRLRALGFSDADAGVLTATLAARQADLETAQRKRDDAAAAARRKSIDLGRVEQLVRRGVRSLGEYDALLASLGYDDASRAQMDELLQLRIADDRQAEALRAAAAAADRVKGLTLEQLRRGVVLGVRTAADYERFLVQNGFTADAVAVLMAELADDVAQADAARQRRAQADARSGDRAAPLATIARAARLGLVTPDAYQARLVADGYSADDVALELQLLLTEIADIQEQRALRAQAAAAAAPPGLSLAQLERAVKSGAATVEAYRARAITLGYDAPAVATLVQLLEQEVAAQADAAARRAAIGAELQARNLSLAQLEAAVKAGLKSVDDYVAGVEALGYGAADAELLAMLLVTKLGVDTTGDGGG